jgi:hypothetical protein
MTVHALIGFAALLGAYLIFNAMTARFSKVGRLAARISSTSDGTARLALIEEMGATARVRSMAGDAALVHLASLGLGDRDPAIQEYADEVFRATGERALLPLFGSLDSAGRFRVCLLLESLAGAFPASSSLFRFVLPRLESLAARPDEDPVVRQAAARAIRAIDAAHGQPFDVAFQRRRG